MYPAGNFLKILKFTQEFNNFNHLYQFIVKCIETK